MIGDKFYHIRSLHVFLSLLGVLFLTPVHAQFSGTCPGTPCGAGENQVDISVTTDGFPGDISWALIDHTAGDTCNFGDLSGGYDCGDGNGNSTLAANTTYTWNFCYPAGNDLEFKIYDSWGDGAGGYTVDVCGNQVASNGGGYNFCSSESFNNVCHCYNGVQDGGETGVDCGGPDCSACNGTDICENATDITNYINGGEICGNDGGAGNDFDDGDVTSCYDPDSEIWYSFTAPASGEAIINLTSWCGGNTYTPNITLYEGSCGGGLSQLDCGDANYGTTVSDYNLTPGDTYYLSIDIDDINNGGCSNGGDFCFEIGESPNGDCLSDPKIIDECGTGFTIQTQGYSDCDAAYCGSHTSGCGGQNNGDLLNSNYDDDCSTECGNCPAPNGTFDGAGCDMDGSTENNAFWSFTPTQSCDYEVTIDVSNCRDGAGMQYAIYQYDGGSFTNYYAQDGTGLIGTATETFTASTAGSVVIMVDGNAGDICETEITVNPVNCGGCTLPIELLSFDGEAVEKGNLLEWKTASETGNSHFVLQRSEDGDAFESFQEVEGAGTSTTMNSYEVLDPDPYPGVTYYRLKQVDLDGDSSFSKVIAIEREKEAFAIDAIYPNPSEGRIRVELHSAERAQASLSVHDRTGRVVARRTPEIREGSQKLDLEFPELAPGFYMLKLERTGRRGGTAVKAFTIEE